MPLYLENSGYIDDKIITLSTGATLNKYTFTSPETAATITLADNSALITAGNFTTYGAFDLTFTSTANTTVTLPTTGTLATLIGSETFANKILTTPVINNSIMDNKSIFKTDGTTSQIQLEDNKITLGSDTQEVETLGNLIVGGDFTVNGTTHTIESDVTHIVDPVFELGSETFTIPVDRVMVGGSGAIVGTYTNVALNGTSGTGAKATIVIGAGPVFTSITVTTTGSGYVGGDTIAIAADALGSGSNGYTITLQLDDMNFVEDTLDRGLKIYYGNNTSTVQKSFIGWNRDTNDEFTFIKKITAEADVNGSFTGEYGDAKFKDLILTDGNITNSTLTEAANVFATTTGTTTLGGGAVNISVVNSATTVQGGLQVDQTLGVTGETTISNTTTSTNKDTGALKVLGGVGIVENANIGGNLGVVGTTQLNNNVTIQSDKSLTYKGTAITANGAELNVLSGITANGAELNILDGDTSATNTTIDGSHQVVYNAGGTMQQVTMTKIRDFCTDSSSTTALSQSAHRTEIIPCNSSTFGIKLAPIVMGATQISKNYDGWYFKNIQVTDGASNSVGTSSWTMYPPDSTWKFSDLQYLQIGFMPLIADKRPKIIISYSDSIFPSGNLIYPTMASTVADTKYEYLVKFMGIDSPLQIPGHTVIYTMSQDPTNDGPGFQGFSLDFPPGTTSPTIDSIINNVEITLEGNAADDTEMIIHECNWVTTSQGTLSYKFTNDSVVQAQSAQAVAALYAVLYNKNVSQTDTDILVENNFTSAGYNGTIVPNVYGGQNVLANYINNPYNMAYPDAEVTWDTLTTIIDYAISMNYTPQSATWSVSPSLPDGLMLTNAGAIQGTATTLQSSIEYTITMNDYPNSVVIRTILHITIV